ILEDSQASYNAGRSSELDVLEAQSGLAVRRTKQNTALQSYYDALGHARTLYGSVPDIANKPIRAVDVPPATNAPISYGQSFQRAFLLNPDYLIQSEKVDQERVRLGFAKNQRLPELNVNGSYGYNGLGLTVDDSYASLESRDFASWSVGVELRIPLVGNIRGRNNLTAAKLTMEESLVNLKSVETQIANSLNTAVQKARGWAESIQSYETVVRFNENVLKTQIARLNAGQVEARKVLEVEADLFDARQSYADALVQYRRSLLELELADGSVLKDRGLEVKKEELRERTMALVHGRSLPYGHFTPLAPRDSEPAAD
ncbi:MAG TPA: TolC family protein, partial [Verrucomicrobiae bacterium]|nr:TolC family protein [Verrucomicrobiae bacterium]